MKFIKKWLDCNKLSLNLEKTEYVDFSPNNLLKMRNCDLMVHKCDLNELNLNDDLNVHDHCFNLKKVDNYTSFVLKASASHK